MPYKILFCDKIPKHVTAEKLESIFSAYNGFIEVRYIADKNVAFIEYLSEDFASYVLQDVKVNNLVSFEDPETGIKLEARLNFGK